MPPSKPPVFARQTSETRSVKLPPERFKVIPCLFAGSEVIDYDGRTILQHPSRDEAQEIATSLNRTAQNGSRALAKHLSELSIVFELPEEEYVDV